MNKQRITTVRLRLQREWRIWSMNHQVVSHSQPDDDMKPVVLFNASSRLSGFSQNAAFTLLTGWGLQLANVPILYFACRSGMTRCVLGTDPDDISLIPPCKSCIRQTKKLTASAKTNWFEYQPDENLTVALRYLNIEELINFEFSSDSEALNIPLGKLVLPSVRWTLRRHHLIDDTATRSLFGEFIQSAFSIAVQFCKFLLDVGPQAVVVFNGLQYPEATVRWVTQQMGIRAITHEVGFQPFSAFFSDGQVTAYPIEIPDDFELSPDQQERIDAHLSKRFLGDFTMAGVKFWPEMNGLSQEFLLYANQFKHIIPIFTNVIFDTSQVHANTVFSNMFSWLELLVNVIKTHKDTLFVIRAHPDEMRDGKKSRESVQDWITCNQIDQQPNVVFVGSDGALSSYDLVRRSKFVMVYNSSIGLEATLLGVPVLCGGKARYTQYPTVFFPQSPETYREMAENFLSEEQIVLPDEFQRNAYRVLYHQFFRSSLLFGDYLDAHPTPGYVQLKNFALQDLLAENVPTMSVIINGVLNGKPFLIDGEGDD